MSSPESSPTRGISTWWKQLKKHGSSNESFHSQTKNIDNVLTPSKNGSNGNLARPTLNFKSRSYNSVRQNASNEQLIRQQRDEFIASQKRFGFGNEVFGVPLEDSVKIAESLISVPSEDPGDFIRYRRIPLLIGKCGWFLKEKGLKVEGIFRVAGSSRRVKELQYVFSSPPDYGRKLNWDGYTVHDAASLFRRFLNNLPEPLVPLELYEKFREPVKSRPRIINHIQARNDTIEKKIRSIQQQQQQQQAQQQQDNPESIETADDDDKTGLSEEAERKKQKEMKKQKKIAKDLRSALKEYRLLIDQLPEAQKHLLYYLLDLLTMFSDNSKDNLMPARNLAAIFQPSILSHPDHDLTPEEYALSQAVVEVLIEYSKRLLPDVKKFVNNSESNLPKSAKTSSVNLLSVMNNSNINSRPHSRSLSDANGVPDAINANYTTQNSQSRKLSQHKSEDDDETSDDDYHSITEDIPPRNTSTIPMDIPKGRYSIPKSSPPLTKTRPMSMFVGGASEERQSRWLPKSPPKVSDDLLGFSRKDKDSWFKRLRSSSRGKKE